MNNDDIEKAKNDELLRAHFQKVLSSPEEMTDYLSICGSCEHLNENRVCTACGCGVDIKVKKRTASCPIGKWRGPLAFDD